MYYLKKITLKEGRIDHDLSDDSIIFFGEKIKRCRHEQSMGC